MTNLSIAYLTQNSNVLDAFSMANKQATAGKYKKKQFAVVVSNT